MSICFLGGGNMAGALVGGMLKNGFSSDEICAIDPDAACRASLEARFGIRTLAMVDDSVQASEVIVLAVKPQQLKTAVAPLKGRLSSQLIISIAAGLKIADIGRWLGGYTRLIRCMPNTPALIGRGVTGMVADASVDQRSRDRAGRILSSVGSVLWVDSEAMIDAVTAISGSGPAYVFLFLEALATAAREQGFDEDTARRLALETTLGAGELAGQAAESFQALRLNVTSRGGTTAAALDTLASAGWLEALVDATRAAAVRAKVLGETLGKD